MKVKLLYFGTLKDHFEAERDLVELAEGADVAALIRQLRGREADQTGVPPGVWQSLAVAVNLEYASGETLLHDDDEVALLPPVSGGCR